MWYEEFILNQTNLTGAAKLPDGSFFATATIHLLWSKKMKQEFVWDSITYEVAFSEEESEPPLEQISSPMNQLSTNQKRGEHDIYYDKTVLGSFSAGTQAIEINMDGI